jgi:hypothetical protein
MDASQWPENKNKVSVISTDSFIVLILESEKDEPRPTRPRFAPTTGVGWTRISSQTSSVYLPFFLVKPQGL